ncbi:NOL1/NOP2/sun family putative RNA met [Xylariomycetidae sp. FL2044]|nr:NOL1/NOP2/sun family putative RNA met [Xylariomycetidae sp. FL2044]
MGVGRRMKKQQAPEPLSEEHFNKLKKRKGLQITDLPAPELPVKRRRTSKKQERQPKDNGRSKTAGKAVKGSKKQPIESDTDSDLDLEGDSLDGDELGDDFLGDDYSVYDSDQEDGRKGRHLFSDDDDDDTDSDDDREERLNAANIEGLSMKLDKQLEEEAEENERELREEALQTNIAGEKPQVLEDGELQTSTLLAPDLQMLRTRINETIRVLDDFSNLSDEGRSRAEYTTQLLKDICAYYGYSEYLAEKLMSLFSPKEAFAFFEANETPRPVVIRTNTLRTHRRELAQALINRGVTLEPVGKWSKVGLQIFESNVPLGATPEYLAGHYILQAASSFLPVMALSPQENERVLDMASAPGGKTTHLAALMKNTGSIFANELNKSRAKALIGNVHRLGARNVVVCAYDAREFPRVMGGFDRVLLDAPCSGTGVIAKDASVKTNKGPQDFMQLPHTQKQLLLAAIDSVNHVSKTGGYIVYSTCSVTVEENEQVVNYALSRRPNVKLVETDLPFGKEGFTKFAGKVFDPSLRLTRRYYPHTYNVDGFFVAKFKKVGPTPPNATLAPGKESNTDANSARSTNGVEVIDKTPITDESENGEKDDDFGGFDEEGDAEYIERGKRNAMRRRGLDPNALNTQAAKTNGKEKAGKKQKS